MIEPYKFCSQCIIWIPQYFQDTHNKECHQKRSCLNIHPFIKNGSLYSRVGIIQEDTTHNEELQESFQKKINISSCEPNWVICKLSSSFDRLRTKFSNRYCFLNNLDLYRAGLEAFNPVLVHIGDMKQVFIAFPNDFLQLGTAAFSEEGIKNHFPVPSESHFVHISKISSKHANFVNLNFEDLHQLSSIEKCNNLFKRKYVNNFDFGNPFHFTKKGSLNLENNDSGKTININYTCDNEDVHMDLNQSNISLNDNKLDESFSRSVLSTSTLQTGDTLNLEQLRISPPKDDSNSSSFKTSTPRKSLNKSSTSKKSNKKKLSENIASPSASPIASSSASINKDEVFYWFSHKSIILPNDSSALKEIAIKNQVDNEKVYFKTDTFHEVQNIVDKKIELHREGDLSWFWSGILISGLPGTGKALLVKEISKSLDLGFISVNLLGWSEQNFKSTFFEDGFNKAKKCSPSILLFEKLDSLCSVSDDGKNAVQYITKLFKKVKECGKIIVPMATTNHLDAIPSQLRQSGRFDKEIILPLPNPSTRFHLLWQILDSLEHCVSVEEAQELAKKASGFSGADLEFVLKIAWEKALVRFKKDFDRGCSLSLSHEDLRESFKEVAPVFLRQQSSVVSRVSWNDIKGYEEVKEKFKKLLQYHANTSLDSPDSSQVMRGMLLYGPPGCSKTMLVKALVCETRFTFFPVKCSDLLSKYVGDTEKKLCDVFERALQAAPSVIFMDEVDSLCGERAGASDNCVVPELLSLLRSRSGNDRNVLVIGATNRPHVVDEALLAPGGLEILIHVDLPDCSSRCAVWEGLLCDVPKEQIDIKSLCSKTENFSCAEICAIYRNACQPLLMKVHRGLAKIENLRVSQNLLESAIARTSPRTPPTLLSSIQSFKSKFKSRAPDS